MIRVLLAPSERLASTNSFSRIESVKPRTSRAMYGQVKSTMIAITRLEAGLDRREPERGSRPCRSCTRRRCRSRSGAAAARASRRRSARGACRRSRGSSRRSARRRGRSATAMPRGDDADDQRRPRAVHRADEEVATLAVGAEPELRVRAPSAGRTRPAWSAWYDSVFGWPVIQAASGPPKIAMRIRRTITTSADERRLVLAEALPEEPRAAPALGRRRLWAPATPSRSAPPPASSSVAAVIVFWHPR